MSGQAKHPTTLLRDAFWFQEGPGVRKWQFTNSGIKLLNVANIEKNGTLNLAKTDRHLSEVEVRERYSHFLVDEGDLVIASSGISFDEDGLLRTRGAFVNRDNLPLCLNTSTIRFKSLDGVSDLQYLRHWLQSREFRTQITRRVTGTAQQNFGPSHLNDLVISLPPLDEQRRIAAILDKADELRAARRRALAQLDTLTQSIFLEMFGDPATNPKGWPTPPMSELFLVPPIFGSMIPPVAEKQKWLSLRVGNIQDWKLDLTDSKYINLPADSVARHGVEEGDILMARAIASQEHLGKCIVAYPNGQKWAFDSHLMRMRLRRDRAEPEYIRQLLRTRGGRRLFLKASRKSTVQYNINTKEISSLHVPIPPADFQRAFLDRVQHVNGVRASEEHAVAALGRLFMSLQDRAFRGEL